MALDADPRGVCPEVCSGDHESGLLLLVPLALPLAAVAAGAYGGYKALEQSYQVMMQIRADYEEAVKDLGEKGKQRGLDREIRHKESRRENERAVELVSNAFLDDIPDANGDLLDKLRELRLEVVGEASGDPLARK